MPNCFACGPHNPAERAALPLRQRCFCAAAAEGSPRPRAAGHRARYRLIARDWPMVVPSTSSSGSRPRLAANPPPSFCASARRARGAAVGRWGCQLGWRR